MTKSVKNIFGGIGMRQELWKRKGATMEKVIWLKKRDDEMAKHTAWQEDFLNLVRIGRESASSECLLYRVFVTRTRLMGYCRMLFFDAQYHQGAEYFGLRFDEEGIADYQRFADADKEEIRAFLQKEPYEEIAYQQALALIRDALLQNYRYGRHVDMLSKITSVHLVKAVQYEPADRPEMNFYLMGLTKRLAAEYYLEACANNDAALTYDLLSPEKRDALAERETYCQMWNHEMQFCHILRINWREQATDAPWELTGQMLLISPTKKLLETQVYFEFARHEGLWWIKEADIHVLEELGDKSCLNPLDDRVFVGVVEGATKEVCRVLERLKNVDITGESEEQIHYKWFKQETNQEGSVDILDIYLAQIIAQREQVIIYSKHLDELNQVIEQLLECVEQPLLIRAKGTDTIENIYRTVKLRKAAYEMTPKDSCYYYFAGEEAKRLAAQCFHLLPEKWHYYKSSSCGLCETIGQGWVEVQIFPESTAVHFYHITPEEILAEAEDACCRYLAEVSLESGQKSTSCIRSVRLYQPLLGSAQEAEKRWRFECEQIRTKKVTYL